MPVVPQVEQAALPGVRQQTVANPADFGGIRAEQLFNQGKSLEAAGADISRSSQIMQERENADLVFRAETALKNKQLEFDNSLNERRGQSAWGATKDAEKFWGDAVKDADGTFTNDRQRQIFQQTADRLRFSHLEKVSGYEAGQRRESLTESTKASIVGSINLAAANANDPNVIATSKDDITKRNAVLSTLNGWAPEKAKFELNADLTNLHKQVIQQLVSNDPKKAKEYYEFNKGEIAGSDHDAIEKVLNEGNVRLTAQTVGDKVTAEGMDETTALAYVRKNFEGKDEEAAITEVKTRFAESEVIKTRAKKDNSDKAWKVIAGGGSRRQIPAQVWASLDGKEQEQINSHLREKADRAKREAEGKATKTDITAFYSMQKQAYNDPQAFAATNLLSDPRFSKLSNSDQQEVIKLQVAAAKGDDKFKEAQTVDSQITAAAAGAGIKDTQEKAIAEGKIRQAIDAEGRARGKPLDAEQRQKVIDKMFIDGEVVQGAWYLNDPNKKVFEVYGTEDASKFVPKIPSAEKTKIKEALQRAGKKGTDAEIANLYKRKAGL